MTRIISQLAGAPTPRINRDSVAQFFKQRAAKSGQLGHIQTVIYQDKNPDLANQRDAAEKSKLLPLLNLKGSESVLDVGCGTGRWADVITPLCNRYLGTDFSQDLIDIATNRFSKTEKTSFLCISADNISYDTIRDKFQIILSLGLFIYLNDDELTSAIKGYAAVAADSCKILLREPVGTSARLTIQEHFSEDMEQVYNAIYRTEDELMTLIEQELLSTGFRLNGMGDVYESALNNRSDTKQKWYLLEK